MTQNIFIHYKEFPVSNNFVSNCATYNFVHQNEYLYMLYTLQYDDGGGNPGSITNIGNQNNLNVDDATFQSWLAANCDNTILSNYLCNFLGTTLTVAKKTKSKK